MYIFLSAYAYADYIYMITFTFGQIWANIRGGFSFINLIGDKKALQEGSKIPNCNAYTFLYENLKIKHPTKS